MDSAPKRPWFRLHWLTWLVLLVIIATLSWRELEPQQVRSGRGWYINGPVPGYAIEYGWPAAYLYWSDGTTPANLHWFPPSLIFNLLFGLLLVSATGLVIEGWLRSAKRWQMTLRTVMGLVFVTALLLTLDLRRTELLALSDIMGGFSTTLVSLSDLANPLRWPLVFALACMIYSLGWLAYVAVLRCWSLLRRARA